MEDTLKLHEKWQDILPLNVGNFSRKDCIHMEKVTFKDFVKKLIELKFPASVAHKVLQNKKYKELGLYWKLKFYVVKMFLAGR